jgi:23S rRNA (guanosine2251-2'-O)-methyltransferase
VSERLVAGLQPVREAVLAHGARLSRLLLERRHGPRLDALERLARERGVAVIERRERRELDRIARGTEHQGVLAWAPPLALVELETLLSGPDALLLALDGVEDPQNFGAVIRSAVALGGAAVVWGEHGAAPLSAATFRASAGAVEHARLCRVPSLVGALHEAAASGAQVVGLDPAAPAALRELDLGRPTVLVLGAEHSGLGGAVRRACGALAGLGRRGAVASLNVSVAAGIALYEVARQRADRTIS